jgi:hypothetical protein
VVHAAFVVVAYGLMLQSARPHVLTRIWSDIAPATCSCAAVAATSVPVSMAMSAADTASVANLLAVTVVAAASYLAVLRTWFPSSWRMVVALVRNLVPDRIRTRRPTPALATAAVED